MPSNFRWTAFFIVPVNVIKDLKDLNVVEVGFGNRVERRCFPDIKQLGHLIQSSVQVV